MTNSRLWIFLAILNCAPAFAQVPGSGSQLYGNVGDPYATEGGKQSCKKHLTACRSKPLSGNSYCLDQDVTASPDSSGKCFVISEGTKLDLGAHAVSGRIYANRNIEGAHIFNGSVTCDFPDTHGDVGCLALIGGSPPELNLPAEIHHLTVRNLAENAVSRGIFVDWSPARQKPRFGLRIYNTTIVTPTCVLEPNKICTRVNNVRVQSQKALSLEAFNNDWTCSTQTNACQGIELFDVSNAHIHHNRITMDSDKMPQDGRAIDCDGNAVPGSDHCEVDSNYIVANGNRAFRVRSSTNAHFHDNYIASCADTASGCIYLYDQRSFPEDYGDMVIERNTFEMAGGTAIYMRCGKGAVVRDNLVKPVTEGKRPAGLFALVTSWGLGCTTDVTMLRNGIVAQPNIRVMSNLPASAAATVCESGKVEGSGKISLLKVCP